MGPYTVTNVKTNVRSTKSKQFYTMKIEIPIEMPVQPELCAEFTVKYFIIVQKHIPMLTYVDCRDCILGVFFFSSSLFVLCHICTWRRLGCTIHVCWYIVWTFYIYVYIRNGIPKNNIKCSRKIYSKWHKATGRVSAGTVANVVATVIAVTLISSHIPYSHYTSNTARHTNYLRIYYKITAIVYYTSSFHGLRANSYAHVLQKAKAIGCWAGTFSGATARGWLRIERECLVGRYATNKSERKS